MNEPNVKPKAGKRIKSAIPGLIPAPVKKSPKKARSARPVTTQQRILNAAYREFSHHGFAGARIDRITKSAKVNPRMIYHHFGSKEKLYRAVLVDAYADIRAKESSLEIEHLDPIQGIIALFEFTYDHFEQTPNFIWLLANENLMRGKFVLSFSTVTELTSPLRSSLERLVKSGKASGALAKNADALQIYVTIASLSWFHLGNAYTLSAMFGQNLTDPGWRAKRKAHARHVLRSYLLAGAAPPEKEI